MSKLLAIAFIWFGCAVCWVILGATLVGRTNDYSGSLDSQVHALFGPPGRQSPPTAAYQVTETTKETVTTNPNSGTPTQQVVEREVTANRDVPLESSDIHVSFALEQRKKGLLWFPTYQVQFAGKYNVVNPTNKSQLIEVSFPLQPKESPSLSFDDFRLTDERGTSVDYQIDKGIVSFKWQFEPNAARQFVVGYKTRGTSEWRYLLAEGGGEVRHFNLAMETRGFDNVNFPAGTTSPTAQSRRNGSWTGEWKYVSLISSMPIGIEMPTRLNPGPLASKVTFFAPLSLLFFFFVVAILATVQKRDLHPMHYLLLGCAFFAFHLLFAYLVDKFDLLPSFLVASVVSCGLVVTYARHFVGWRFALREMLVAQLIYLVLFSHTFFWEGFTGLAVTIGAILTLFVVMQITGRVDWREAFARRVPLKPEYIRVPVEAGASPAR